MPLRPTILLGFQTTTPPSRSPKKRKLSWVTSLLQSTRLHAKNKSAGRIIPLFGLSHFSDNPIFGFSHDSASLEVKSLKSLKSTNRGTDWGGFQTTTPPAGKSARGNPGLTWVISGSRRASSVVLTGTTSPLDAGAAVHNQERLCLSAVLPLPLEVLPTTRQPQHRHRRATSSGKS